MKNFNYYQIVLFIIILLKVSNCANKYENEREKVEKSLPREKRVIQAASSAFAAYKIVKEVLSIDQMSQLQTMNKVTTKRSNLLSMPIQFCICLSFLFF